MRKMVIATAALAAGWIIAGSATGASAHAHKPCNCGPLKPTVHVNVVHPTSSYTRYHDQSVYKHVARIHPIVTITKVQPIVHIHDVTRIHHHTIFYIKNTYASQTVHLRPIVDVRSSIVNTYDGGCSCHP